MVAAQSARDERRDRVAQDRGVAWRPADMGGVDEARGEGAPSRCRLGRSPFGLIGNTDIEVGTSGLRTTRLVSMPARPSRDSSTSPAGSEPIAPAVRTAAPSLANVSAVPAAVPAAVIRICSTNAVSWPAGMSVTGRTSTSRM